MLVKYRHMFLLCVVYRLNVVPFWTKKESDLQLNQRVYRSSIGKLFHRRNDLNLPSKSDTCDRSTICRVDYSKLMKIGNDNFSIPLAFTPSFPRVLTTK